jgi:hypothetical protein
MIVDDIAINRTILERQLEQLGIGVISCASGVEALAQLDEDVDLILTDHNMPEMDGLELAEAVRATGSIIPILLLSSSPDLAEKDPARVHLQGLLQKPLPRQELFAQLEAMVISPPKVVPASLRKMRILAAEDNKTNQLVFRKMIKDLDVDLTFAMNGEEAVARFKEINPDIIFMDISMPKMDGKEATQAIRILEAETGKHVPIVAMTAHAMDGDDKGILAAGLDHYLTKPLRKPEIFAQVEAAVIKGMLPPLPAEPAQATG